MVSTANEVIANCDNLSQGNVKIISADLSANKTIVVAFESSKCVHPVGTEGLFCLRDLGFTHLVCTEGLFCLRDALTDFQNHH